MKFNLVLEVLFYALGFEATLEVYMNEVWMDYMNTCQVKAQVTLFKYQINNQ